MKTLDEFDGLAGYRWGALLSPAGHVRLSGNAPPDSHQKVTFIKRLLDHAEAVPESADLFFERGKVILRRGNYGLLLLFCDTSMNSSMLGFVLADLQPEQESGSDISTTNTSSSQLIQTMTDATGLVPQEIVAELMELYIEYLGPLAPKLAAKEAKKGNLDLKQIQINQWANLLNVLAARISDENKQEAFLDRAVMLKTRF